jgi:triosephosphate isomerase
MFCGNWKMNNLLTESLNLVRGVMLEIDPSVFDFCEVVFAPSFPYLLAVKEIIEGTPFKLSAQNCYWEEKGAFTGEVSPLMLRDVGCSYCIVGHSERRNIFGEIDRWINKKVKALLSVGITPILCVGEKLEERREGKLFDVIYRQVTMGLDGVDLGSYRVVIAYEPVWAIGTGINAAPEDAEEVHSYIRGIVAEKYGMDVAGGMTILYGGSVNPFNIGDLMKMENIDGTLIGGSSLKVRDFVDIIYGGLEGKGVWR